MLSHTNNRAYTKPLGYQGDYELLDVICAGAPRGDGLLGQMLDKWVLQLPFMYALRTRSAQMADCLLKVAQDWKRAVPMPVTVLAISTSQDVLMFFRDSAVTPMNVTCIEMDAQAFARPKAQLERRNQPMSVTFVQDNVLQSFMGNERVYLDPQEVIFAANILEYLEDKDVIKLLDWIYDKLLPGGAVILGQTHEANPDRSYLEHILEWVFHQRGQEALRDLFAQSKFCDATLEFHSEGVQLILSCRKVSVQTAPMRGGRNVN